MAGPSPLATPMRTRKDQRDEAQKNARPAAHPVPRHMENGVTRSANQRDALLESQKRSVPERERWSHADGREDFTNEPFSVFKNKFPEPKQIETQSTSTNTTSAARASLKNKKEKCRPRDLQP